MRYYHREPQKTQIEVIELNEKKKDAVKIKCS
jgi:hypothetical protein